VALAIAEQVVDFLKTGLIRNAVNAPSVAPDMLPKVRPYIDIAEKMGRFMGQIVGQVISDRLKKVSMRYTGTASAIDTKPVTISAIKGLLASIADEVNYVNAPILLKERGIDLVESTTSKEEVFTNTIEMTLEFDKGTRTLAGSVFGPNDMRIVSIDKYSIEVILEGYMLVIYNKDLPGTVGKFGTILGESGINIARLFLGRDRQEGTAIIIINVDTEVPKEVLDRLRKVPNALSVQEVVI